MFTASPVKVFYQRITCKKSIDAIATVMTKPNIDPTQRFYDRVENYVRYRPHYPDDVLSVLQAETGFSRSAVVADIGSGTGISTHLFLRHGNVVFGVEPNLEMRQAAETNLQCYDLFHSIDGTAERTTLSAQSVDYVIAAQAFHWFNRSETQLEFTRILQPGGWVVLMWNARRTESTPFLQAYEALIQEYGTDYGTVNHRNIQTDVMQSFWPSGHYVLKTLYNEQCFDFEGLKGRLLSSSYMPDETHPTFHAMVQALAHLFDQYEERGVVCIEYDTEVYFGQWV